MEMLSAPHLGQLTPSIDIIPLHSVVVWTQKKQTFPARLIAPRHRAFWLPNTEGSKYVQPGFLNDL